jgi:hypothetical protein
MKVQMENGRIVGIRHIEAGAGAEIFKRLELPGKCVAGTPSCPSLESSCRRGASTQRRDMGCAEAEELLLQGSDESRSATLPGRTNHNGQSDLDALHGAIAAALHLQCTFSQVRLP